LLKDRTLRKTDGARSRHPFSDCLVVSIDLLADVYRYFIDDIDVVPNRFDDRIW
jgi:hypothetical protein